MPPGKSPSYSSQSPAMLVANLVPGDKFSWIHDQLGSSAESSSAGQQEGVESADQQEGLRHRTGE